MREPTEFMEQLGQRLRDRRLALRFSLRDVADRTDLSVAGLHGIETAKSMPGADTILRLCFMLGISPNKVLLGKEKFE
jgi:transcriptional regulator with XRE-family HTH domain